VDNGREVVVVESMFAGSNLRFLLAAIGGLVLLAWLWALARARATGVPPGASIVAVDEKGEWEEGPRIYRSQRLGLVGRPDFVVRTRQGLQPVEVKTARGGRLREGDRLQMGAYLVLLEEATGERPPWGVVKYRNGRFRVRNTPQLRKEVLATAARIREKRAGGNGGRSHRNPARCRACGLRDTCREALV
jgi:CRISPR-associated exonuclease Cas4